LLEVFEPEIGHNDIDLGLVYHASLNGDGVDVMMTLTTLNRPLAETIVSDALERLARWFPHRTRISVELVWNPPWSPDLIADYVRGMLQNRAGRSAE
jgi:metal-sulfur cluster biosynthetic enzyme